MYFTNTWVDFLLCLLLAAHPSCTVKESVIIDTDAGGDDAMAILMVLSNRRDIHVEAITCVGGNTGVHNVSKNVLKTLAVVDRLDIPVYVGSTSGLVYHEKSSIYFGYDGLGDFNYINPPSMKLLQKDHAAVALAEIVRRKPGAITILCIGPLTNIALASHINKDFFYQVKKILILGGSYKGDGNMGPGKEFNMYTDPEAAQSVFSRLPHKTDVLMLPIETIKRNAFSLSWRMNTLGKLGSSKIAFLNLAERKTFNGSKWTSYDPSLAAIFLFPDIINSTKVGHPVVNTTLDRGTMNVTFEEGFVKIITSINRIELKRILIGTLSDNSD